MEQQRQVERKKERTTKEKERKWKRKEQNQKGKNKVNYVDDEGTINQEDWRTDYDRESEKWNSWEQNYDNQSWNNQGEANSSEQRNGITEATTVGRIELHGDENSTTTATSRYATMGVLPEEGQ